MGPPALSDVHVTPGGTLRRLLGSTLGRAGSPHASAVLKSRGGDALVYDREHDVYLLFGPPIWSLAHL